MISTFQVEFEWQREMKLIILLACLAGALAFEVDFANVVPIYETVEWRAAYPEQAARVAIRTVKDAAPRVWGGHEAVRGEVPYQVAIVVLLSRQGFCGGSVISHDVVLSAAQCFPGLPNSVVEAGSTDRNTVQDFINVLRTVIHENHVSPVAALSNLIDLLSHASIFSQETKTTLRC